MPITGRLEELLRKTDPTTTTSERGRAPLEALAGAYPTRDQEWREERIRTFERGRTDGEPSARYTTDDRDFQVRNVLEIFPGENGDWYVSTVPEGHRAFGTGVRISTSGGAQQHAPGLANAIAAAYRAILAGDGK